MLTREQIDKAWLSKKAIAQEILGEALLHREIQPDLSGDRCRCDLMLFEGKVGHRGPKRGDSTVNTKENEWDFDFFNFEVHELIHPQLNSFIEEFSKSVAPVPTAQIRFRIGADGRRGIWIDSSRENLLQLVTSPDGKAWLKKNLEKGWAIELGQKFSVEGGQESEDLESILKPTTHVWLPSFNSSNHAIPLQSYIKNFSQGGVEANRALIAHGMDLVESAQIGNKITWAELGAGYGNLTAAYASLWDDPRWVVESDAFAAQALALNAKNYFSSTKIHRIKAEMAKDLENVDLLLADPPRSGFGNFFKDFTGFEYLLHISCDLKGLVKDSAVIRDEMKLLGWSALDLFPGTPYIEVLSLWQRK